MIHSISINKLGLKQCACGSRLFVNGKCAYKPKETEKTATLLDHCMASINKKV